MNEEEDKKVDFSIAINTQHLRRIECLIIIILRERDRHAGDCSH